MRGPHPTTHRRGAGARAALAAMAMLAAMAGLAGTAHAAPGEGAVRECVAQNLVRYSTPDRAAVAQYVDVEAACRSAIDGEGDVAVTITPVGPRSGTDSEVDRASGASGGGESGTGGGGSGSTPARGQAAGGAESLSNGEDESANLPSRPEPAPPASETATSPSQAQDIRALLGESESASAVPTSLSALPAGVWAALVIALSVLAGAALLRGVRRAR